MKKIIATVALLILVIACNSKEEGNMIVQGTIKGLKKGRFLVLKIHLIAFSLKIFPAKP